MRYDELALSCAELRNEKGLTQHALADMTGLSRATINAFENKRAADLGVRKLVLILDALGAELSIKPKSRFPTLEELTRDA